MKQIPARGPTVTGIDIYHGNNVDDFAAQKRLGREFCFHKATDGNSFVDPKFHIRFPKIKAAGLIRGAYHFFHPAKDPTEQADLFCHVVQPVLESGDLIFMDWEVTDGDASDKDRTAGLIFLKHVESVLHKKPIIYGPPYFLDALKLDSRFGVYHLWIAEYGVHAPKIPSPWTDWQFWQTSESGIDFDVFNGDAAALRALAAG